MALEIPGHLRRVIDVGYRPFDLEDFRNPNGLAGRDVLRLTLCEGGVCAYIGHANKVRGVEVLASYDAEIHIDSQRGFSNHEMLSSPGCAPAIPMEKPERLVITEVSNGNIFVSRDTCGLCEFGLPLPGSPEV